MLENALLFLTLRNFSMTNNKNNPEKSQNDEIQAEIERLKEKLTIARSGDAPIVPVNPSLEEKEKEQDIVNNSRTHTYLEDLYRSATEQTSPEIAKLFLEAAQEESKIILEEEKLQFEIEKNQQEKSFLSRNVAFEHEIQSTEKRFENDQLKERQNLQIRERLNTNRFLNRFALGTFATGMLIGLIGMPLLPGTSVYRLLETSSNEKEQQEFIIREAIKTDRFVRGAGFTAAGAGLFRLAPQFMIGLLEIGKSLANSKDSQEKKKEENNEENNKNK